MDLIAFVRLAFRDFVSLLGRLEQGDLPAAGWTLRRINRRDFEDGTRIGRRKDLAGLVELDDVFAIGHRDGGIGQDKRSLAFFREDARRVAMKRTKPTMRGSLWG